MYSPQFWQEFNTRPEISSDTVKRVDTGRFVYQISESDSLILNKVFYIREGDLDDIFTELQDIFKNKNNGFHVVVRGSDRPDLESYLEDHGFKNSKSYDLRVMELTQANIEVIDRKEDVPYQLRELSKEEMYSESIFQLLNRCFPDQIQTLKAHNSINDLMYNKAEGIGSILRNYALYDGETPIAFGSLFEMGEFNGLKIANLSGAATLPEYRKQGLYTLMLYLRCQAAMDKSIDVLYIKADQKTSSPIVAKYGFETVEVLKQFVPE